MDRNPDLKKQNNQEYHHGNLRKALVDTALGILKEEGKQSLSLRCVAKRVGVSPTAPYSHFKDKTSLLAAVAREGYLAMAKSMELEALGTITEKQRILSMAKGYVNFALNEESLFRLMFGNEIGPFCQFPELEKAATVCKNLLFNGDQEDDFDNKKVFSHQSVQGLAVWSMVHGLAILIINGKAQSELFEMNGHDSLVEAVASLLVLAE